MKYTYLEKCSEFVRNGLSIRQDKKLGGIPITRIETIANGKIDEARFGYAGIDDDEKYNEYYLVEGDILISHINSLKHLGKTAIYNGIPHKLIHGMNLLCIRIKKDIILPRFLLYYSKSKFFREQILKISNQSVNQCSFSATNLKKKIKIPLIPLEEQKRIVHVLDQADSLRQKRQQAISLLDDYLKAVFFEMFGDPVTNPKGIKTAKIKELGDAVTGNTPPRKMAENYGDFIEWIKSDNINNHHHYLTKATEYLSEKGLQKGRSVPAGSILVTCIAGSLSCIGNVSMADRKVAFNQQINAIVPKPGIEPSFLYSQILFGKKKFRQASTNSMKGMLSKTNFSEIELMNPDEDLQKEYARIFNSTYGLKQKMLNQSNELDKEFQALMQRNFKL